MYHGQSDENVGGNTRSVPELQDARTEEETLFHSRHSHSHHDRYMNIWLKAYDSFDCCILNETLYGGFVNVHGIKD